VSHSTGKGGQNNIRKDVVRSTSASDTWQQKLTRETIVSVIRCRLKLVKRSHTLGQDGKTVQAEEIRQTEAENELRETSAASYSNDKQIRNGPKIWLGPQPKTWSGQGYELNNLGLESGFRLGLFLMVIGSGLACSHEPGGTRF